MIDLLDSARLLDDHRPSRSLPTITSKYLISTDCVDELIGHTELRLLRYLSWSAGWPLMTESTSYAGPSSNYDRGPLATESELLHVFAVQTGDLGHENFPIALELFEVYEPLLLLWRPSQHDYLTQSS